MSTLSRRVEALERAHEAAIPPKPSVVMLVGLDGTACVNGQVYPTPDKAKAAHPSPSGLYVECSTYDARKVVGNDAA